MFYFPISSLTIQPFSQPSSAEKTQNQTDLYFLPCLLFRTSYQVLSYWQSKLLCYLVPSVPIASAQNQDCCSILPSSSPSLSCSFHLRHDYHQKSLPEVWFLPPHLPLPFTPPILQGSHYPHKQSSSCSFHPLYPQNIFLLMSVFFVLCNNVCFSFPSRHKLLKDKCYVFPAHVHRASAFHSTDIVEHLLCAGYQRYLVGSDVALVLLELTV